MQSVPLCCRPRGGEAYWAFPVAARLPVGIKFYDPEIIGACCTVHGTRQAAAGCAAMKKSAAAASVASPLCLAAVQAAFAAYRLSLTECSCSFLLDISAGDTPESVEYRGMQNLLDAAKDHLGLVAGKVWGSHVFVV